MEKKLRRKAIAIAILTVLILLGLAVLFLMKRRMNRPAPTPVPTVETTPEPTAVPTPAPTPEPTKVPADIDSNDSLTRLVNKKHLLDESYVPADLTTVDVHCDHPQQLRKEAADALKQMFDAAIEDEIYFKLISGYRSYAEQRSLWYTYLEKFGQTHTSRIDSYPGASDHQLGLAADIGNWNGNCQLNSCFSQYSTYQWLKEHAHEYGFIERFPNQKESITGVMYSPWHWRYVGVEEATGIHDAGGISMEEYYNQYE